MHAFQFNVGSLKSIAKTCTYRLKNITTAQGMLVAFIRIPFWWRICLVDLTYFCFPALSLAWLSSMYVYSHCFLSIQLCSSLYVVADGFQVMLKISRLQRSSSLTTRQQQHFFLAQRPSLGLIWPSPEGILCPCVHFGEGTSELCSVAMGW